MYVLRKTWDCWSPGTRVDFIEYAEFEDKHPISALVRIMGEQVVMPLHYLVEKRERSSTVIMPSRSERKRTTGRYTGKPKVDKGNGT